MHTLLIPTLSPAIRIRSTANPSSLNPKTPEPFKKNTQYLLILFQFGYKAWNNHRISDYFKQILQKSMTGSQMSLFFRMETPAPISSFGADHQILLIANFSTGKDLSPRNLITVALTNKYLCICDDTVGANPAGAKIKEICYIDFDLKFQLVREAPTYDGSTTNLGTPFAIAFDKAGYQNFVIYSSPQTLLRWKDQLQTMINRRGFHNLFKPMKKIGKGNFASVYLAESIEGKKMVAVKAFSKQATFSQDKGKQSLINEINLMRKFNQQNVLKLYSVFESENSIYMTLEYLQGDQLFNKIQNKHNFSQEEIKQIMSGLLKALAHMHSKRIMHRDLKPQNIMLRSSKSWETVIVDFGLATWADESQYLFVRCGTPGYVAPEIINIKDLKARCNPISDIFSVGLIFHILLTGRSIFPGRNYNDVLNQNRNCDFNLQHFTYKALPANAQDLLRKMLDKNPQTRITAESCLQHPYFEQISRDMSKQSTVFSPLLQLKQNISVPNLHLLKGKISINSHLPMDPAGFGNIREYYPENLNKQNESLGLRRQVSGMITHVPLHH